MEYVKSTIKLKKQVYRIKFKSGKSRTYTKELYQISILQEENIFHHKENVIIVRENDFDLISNLINKYKNLKTKNINLKSIINQLEDKINTLEEYNRYLELENKIHAKGHKSNFFTQ